MLLALVLRAHLAIVLIASSGVVAVAGAQAQTVRPEVVATGLQNPWALAFLPQGRFLVTERPGRMRGVEFGYGAKSTECGFAIFGLERHQPDQEVRLHQVRLDPDRLLAAGRCSPDIAFLQQIKTAIQQCAKFLLL